MIKYVAGDILKADCQALVNPVNCVGVMGKGLALQFKKKYPEMFEEYKRNCERGIMEPGIVQIHNTQTKAYPWFIVNFPTKQHWNSKSCPWIIEDGLSSLRDWIIDYHITSIALPALGCGLGGLDWDKVKAYIENWLGDIENCDTHVFLPKELYGTST